MNSRGLRLSWLPLILLVLATAGAAASGVLMQPTVSAATQLNGVLSATYGASSYVSIADNDSASRTIVNAPDRSETFQDGKVFQIWNGRIIYTAIPRSCGLKEQFIETPPSEDDGFATARFVGFPPSEVTGVGNHFTVIKSGRQIAQFTVQNGYVVQMIEEPTSFQGHLVPRFEETFTDFNHAPKIAIPKASDVVLGLPILLHRCPIEGSPLLSVVNG